MIWPKVVHLRQMMIFIPVGILIMLYGCVVGWAANSIVTLQKPESSIPLTKTESTLLAAFFEVGRFSSAIPAGILGDKIGRKPVIYICSLLHLLAWCLKIFSTSKYALFFARIISGCAVGTGNAVLFIYAGEMSPPRIRGTILSILSTFYYLGILIEYILGAYLEHSVVGVVSLAICFLFFAFGWVIKESPSFLISKSQDAEAKRIYKWLNSSRRDEIIDKEFEAMQEYVHNQAKNKQASGGGFSDPINRKCVGLVFVINFLTQMTGLPAVVVFVHVLFENVDVLSPAKFSFIFALIQYLAVCCTSGLSDMIGRRKMYKVTCGMCVVSHALTATLYFLSEDFTINVPGASWLLLLSISSYACIYSAGLGPLTMIVRSELLPLAVKGIGSGLAVVAAAMSCFLLIFIFHLIQHHFGLAFNFLFFMVNSAGLAVLSHYTLPETKHKTLAEIQAAFSKSG